jgi:hypothetical protein
MAEETAVIDRPPKKTAAKKLTLSSVEGSPQPKAQGKPKSKNKPKTQATPAGREAGKVLFINNTDCMLVLNSNSSPSVLLPETRLAPDNSGLIEIPAKGRKAIDREIAEKLLKLEVVQAQVAAGNLIVEKRRGDEPFRPTTSNPQPPDNLLPVFGDGKIVSDAGRLASLDYQIGAVREPREE